jgi:hypothetical protein
MKDIFKTVIEKGGYDLTALIKKIDTYHVEGKITDEERAELYSLARKSPEAQYDYNTEIEKLWEAVRALQSDKETEGDTNTPEEFNQPTGAHDAYMKGASVVYNGKTYKSIIDNNVWSPDTYPNGWEVIG